jgi:hypothetical protein
MALATALCLLWVESRRCDLRNNELSHKGQAEQKNVTVYPIRFPSSLRQNTFRPTPMP